ncbi:MAG: FAD-dependent monooxygenase [Delftia acidovorans]|nr:FAD-dependent monooxygenase [Delftia acidovorans]
MLVGYGPTAQLLAVALGRQGRSVAVVERWAERNPLPRAVHIDHEIFRIIAAQGLDAPLSAICHGAAKYQWFNADWEELLVIDLSAPPVSGGLSANYINQPLLEEVLDTGVRAQPGVRLFLGREAISVGQNEQGAWVEAKHVATGETERFTGRSVIGCDGANSLVRNYISGGVEDLGFQEHWLVVDVLLKDGVTVEGLGLPESGQYCNPERPTTIGPFAQIIHAALDAGIGHGALQAALPFIREHARPWVDAGVASATQDPLLLQQLGNVHVRLRAADALVARAALAVDAAQRTPTDDSVAAASVAVAQAKALSTSASLLAGSKLFELAGTASTLAGQGLDRFWRNARTHTLHDPVRWKYHAVGNYVLNGIRPPRHGAL